MTKSVNIARTIITTRLTLSRLCRLLLVRLDVYIVTLSDFYSYRLIGKLTAFLQFQEFEQSAQSNLGATWFHFRLAAVLNQLKSKCGLLLAKAAALRVTLNLDGAPITFHSHTHPSHSQTSRLLTLSLSLGVPVPRPTQCHETRKFLSVRL
jgi:hypothetical protein